MVGAKALVEPASAPVAAPWIGLKVVLAVYYPIPYELKALLVEADCPPVERLVLLFATNGLKVVYYCYC